VKGEHEGYFRKREGELDRPIEKEVNSSLGSNPV